MAVIQRPAKQGNATTYQGKVAQGYTGILAAEVDADLDTIYAAWNGGVDTVNIAAGSITADKIAPNQIGTRELADLGIATGDLGNLQVTTPKLADGAVTLAKLDPAVKTAGGDLSGQYPNPAVATINSGVLEYAPRGSVSAWSGGLDFMANGSGSPSQDNTKTAWIWRLAYPNDQVELYRAPAGGFNYVNIFSINNAGKISGGAATGARQHFSPTALTITTYDVVVLCYTLPAITTRGGAVHLHFLHSFYYTSSSTSGNVMITTAIWRNGAPVVSFGQRIGSGGAQVVVPVSPISWVDNVAAGTYTYDLRIQVQSGTGASIIATQYGDLVAQEIG